MLNGQNKIRKNDKKSACDKKNADPAVYEILKYQN